MEFNPPGVANPAANQILQEVTNGVGDSAQENAGKSAKRFVAALSIHDDAISTPELGQQAAFFVKQSISAFPPGDGNLGNDAPEWALVMQNNINNNVNNNHNAAMAAIANIEDAIANIEARAFNSQASEMEDSIAVVRNNAGQEPPQGFPATLGRFHRLNNARTTALLVFYGLEVPHPIHLRKQLLRRHLGIRTAGG
jgi:hypothetical protein